MAQILGGQHPGKEPLILRTQRMAVVVPENQRRSGRSGRIQCIGFKAGDSCPPGCDNDTAGQAAQLPDMRV